MRSVDGPPTSGAATPRLAGDLARAAAVYLVMTAVFFWPVLAGRLITQSGDMLFMAPWDVLRPSELATPGNRMLDDQSREFLSFFEVARQSLARGELPLWNPYILAGTPLLADSQSALLYPLNLGHYLLAAPWGFTVSSLLKVFLTALAAYALARRLGVSHPGGLLSGVAYAFAAFNVFWLNHPHTNATLTFPLELLAVERALWRPGARSAAMLAAVVGLQLLGGHVEFTFLIGIAAGLYALARLAQEHRPAVRSLSTCLAGYVLGAGLGAIQLLPFLELLRESATWEARSASNPFVVAPLGVATLVVPDLFTVDGWGGGHVLHALSLYVGIAPLLLAVVALGARPRDVPLLLGGLAALGLAVAFDVGGLAALVTRLPLFRQNPNYYMVLYPVLAVALLSGFGLDALATAAGGGQRRALSGGRALAVAGGVLLALIVALLVDPADLVSRGAAALGATDAGQVLAGARSALWRALGWLVATLALATALLLCGGARRTACWAILLLAFADAWLAGSGWNPTFRPEHAMPPQAPALRAVQGEFGTYRVAGFGSVLPPNTGVYAGLQDIRGYDVPVLRRFHQYFRRALGGRDTWWVYELPALEPRALPFLGLANVEWLLARGPVAVPLERVYAGEIDVYRNPAFLPRAFLVQRVELVPDGETALQRVLALGGALRDVVILEREDLAGEQLDEGALVPAAKLQAAGDESAGARIVRYEARRVEVEVNSASPAWLVLTDSAYPGWRAFVDASEVAIRRADYLFRAVRVPAGVHRVAFIYTPWSARLGAISSLICAGILLWAWIRGR